MPENNTLLKKIWQGIKVPVLSMVLALLCGMVILLIAGKNPLAAYAALFKGAFGTLPYLGDTLSRSAPIIATGLAIALAFKAGLFNIGAEGQLLVGALSAAIVGHYVNLPAGIHVVVTLLAGMAGGALWAAIPGILKAYRGVHEVISTIMMNYIAYSLTAFAIESLREGVTSKTPKILETAELPVFAKFTSLFDGSNFNAGFFVMILACLAVWFILGKTVLGYEIRAVGHNPLAAEDGGVRIGRNILVAMLISGALAGLGGAERVQGVHFAFVSGLSPNLGFDGIAVALLANNNPFGIILSGILFGAMSSGGLYMDLSADVPVDIVTILQALIILFASAPLLIRWIFRFTARKKEAETNG